MTYIFWGDIVDGILFAVQVRSDSRPVAAPNIRKNEMTNSLKSLWYEQEGQDLVEYALLIGLVALSATAGLNAIAKSINAAFTAVGTSLTSVTTT